jgi:hypothetical protein
VKYLNRLVVVLVLAGGMTILGIMTMGLAETVRFGVIGLAAAGGLMLLLRLAGGSQASKPPSGQAGKPPKSQGKPKP